MSSDVNIHLWLGHEVRAPSLKTLESVLQSIPVPQHVDFSGKPFKRFDRISIFDTSFSRLVLDKEINTNDISVVLAECRPFIGSKFHYEINSAFDCLLYNDNDKSLEETIHPLTINFYGSDYGWRGLECKSYGPIRLDFSNTKTFQVPQSLVDQIKSVANQRNVANRWLQMLPQINRNFEAVSNLAKQLILALNPVHMLICSDLEVHPLTSHAIYHKDVQDYVRDLERIARLHEYGGVYFCGVTPDDPAFIPARKHPPSYGYLRDRYSAGTDEQFTEMLQPMVDTILANPEYLRLTRGDIVNCFESLISTEVHKLNDSYYLSVPDVPFAYLEEPYFRLYEAVFDNANGVAYLV